MAMDSVTRWLNRLEAGDRDEATRRLWEAYFEKLVRLAQDRLGRTPGAAGAEDVAQSAFVSFVRAVEAKRFPRLEDRDDLWQVLLVLTARKAGKLRRREKALKRGGGQVQVFSDLEADDDERPGVDFPAAEPDPAEAAAMAETCSRLLGALEKENLRQVALWRLEGYSNAEIAQRLNRSEGAVERKLKLIREIWEALPEE
jgi:RNA polymerase sigma factor (sigma-70 family)